MKKLYIPYNKKLVEVARENRKNPTQAEKKIWFEVLRSKQFENYKFLRQKPLDKFIADFYCAELMLVIEIDGDSHAAQEEYDILRSEKLDAYGIKVIRYTNGDIISNIDGVYKDLKEKIKKYRGHFGG
ncbi:endonuclease domain-containing protein [Patescibacteria group bacterium]|nr:endonuclease domain-containing protein [Patescibacteria group bacterium]